MSIEEPLAGGFGASDAVVRVGDTVRRPSSDSSAPVNALLLHLESVGFDGAPRYLGTDEQARDVLSYLEGEVPLPPYPAWSMTDDALVEMARLLRRFHDAAASFDATRWTGWSTEWADPLAVRLCATTTCFRRTSCSVTVCRSRSSTSIWPHRGARCGTSPSRFRCGHRSPPTGDGATTPTGSDGIERFGRFARTYGIEPAGATELVEVVFEERAQALGNIRGHLAAGHPVWTENWPTIGGDERAALDDAWLETRRDALIAAVVDP